MDKDTEYNIKGEIIFTRDKVKYVYKKLFVEQGQILSSGNRYYKYDKPSPTGKRHYIFTSFNCNFTGIISKIRSQREVDKIINKLYYVSLYDIDVPQQIVKNYEINKIINNL